MGFSKETQIHKFRSWKYQAVQLHLLDVWNNKNLRTLASHYQSIFKQLQWETKQQTVQKHHGDCLAFLRPFLLSLSFFHPDTFSDGHAKKKHKPTIASLQLICPLFLGGYWASIWEVKSYKAMVFLGSMSKNIQNSCPTTSHFLHPNVSSVQPTWPPVLFVAPHATTGVTRLPLPQMCRWLPHPSSIGELQPFSMS